MRPRPAPANQLSVNTALPTRPPPRGAPKPRRRARAARSGVLWILAAPLVACDDAPPDATPATLTQAQILDPQTCAGCHPSHFEQWSGSMHAYAAEDPVFRAMEAKGQRETEGALGDFCVQCHAPVAHRLGLARTAADLDDLPAHLQGVTCAFCHQIDAVEGTHNNPLRWVQDGVLRGGIADPVSAGHPTAYSALHDRAQLASSDLCGSCHDIVVDFAGAPVHLERTYWEWQRTLYNAEDPVFRLTCGECHMPSTPGPVAVGGPERRVHAHGMPGVDVALTPFPGREIQRQQIQRLLDDSLGTEICVIQIAGGADIEFFLDNLSAGHHFPSGAALDRRLWVELRAFAGDTEVFASGVVGDGEPIAHLDDPQLWLLRDHAFDAEGQPTHDFWKVAAVDREPRTPLNHLPAPTTADPLAPGFINTHTPHRYRVASAAPLTRVEVRLRLRPIGLEILDELVASGDLDPAIRDAMPTFDFAHATWTPEAAVLRPTDFSGREALCVPEFLRR